MQFCFYKIKTASPDVTCSEDYMHVLISHESYPYLSPEQMHLTDPSCHASSYNYTHIVFNVPLHGCGTIKTVDNDTMLFENKVTGTLRNRHDGITRWRQVEFFVTCSFPRKAAMDGLSYRTGGVIRVNEGKQL